MSDLKHADAMDETPTQQIPVMPHVDAMLVAIQSVLAEMKVLSRQVERMNATIGNHVTEIAVFKVQGLAQDAIIQSLTARIVALEAQREELTQSILAKAIALVMALVVVIGGAIAYFVKKTGG